MRESPVDIAILVFPENSASVIYGLYDLLLSAGREWSVITDGCPGRELIKPLLVGRQSGPFEVSNGVRIEPHTTLEHCPAVVSKILSPAVF